MAFVLLCVALYLRGCCPYHDIKLVLQYLLFYIFVYAQRRTELLLCFLINLQLWLTDLHFVCLFVQLHSPSIAFFSMLAFSVVPFLPTLTFASSALLTSLRTIRFLGHSATPTTRVCRRLFSSQGDAAGKGKEKGKRECVPVGGEGDQSSKESVSGKIHADVRLDGQSGGLFADPSLHLKLLNVNQQLRGDKYWSTSASKGHRPFVDVRVVGQQVLSSFIASSAGSLQHFAFMHTKGLRCLAVRENMKKKEIYIFATDSSDSLAESVRNLHDEDDDYVMEMAQTEAVPPVGYNPQEHGDMYWDTNGQLLRGRHVGGEEEFEAEDGMAPSSFTHELADAQEHGRIEKAFWMLNTFDRSDVLSVITAQTMTLMQELGFILCYRPSARQQHETDKPGYSSVNAVSSNLPVYSPKTITAEGLAASMTIVQLKEGLKARKLSLVGRKHVLVDRLCTALTAEEKINKEASLLPAASPAIAATKRVQIGAIAGNIGMIDTEAAPRLVLVRARPESWDILQEVLDHFDANGCLPDITGSPWPAGSNGNNGKSESKIESTTKAKANTTSKAQEKQNATVGKRLSKQGAWVGSREAVLGENRWDSMLMHAREAVIKMKEGEKEDEGDETFCLQHQWLTLAAEDGSVFEFDLAAQQFARFSTDRPTLADVPDETDQGGEKKKSKNLDPNDPTVRRVEINDAEVAALQGAENEEVVLDKKNSASTSEGGITFVEEDEFGPTTPPTQMSNFSRKFMPSPYITLASGSSPDPLYANRLYTCAPEHHLVKNFMELLWKERVERMLESERALAADLHSDYGTAVSPKKRAEAGSVATNEAVTTERRRLELMRRSNAIASATTVAVLVHLGVHERTVVDLLLNKYKLERTVHFLEDQDLD